MAPKFYFANLYERVGFAKEIISNGMFTELDADQRPFKYVVNVSFYLSRTLRRCSCVILLISVFHTEQFVGLKKRIFSEDHQCIYPCLSEIILLSQGK